MKSLTPLIAILALAVVNQPLYGQFMDDFSDLDHTSSPAWEGDQSKFIVNADSQLQLNNVSITDVANLYTHVELKDSATWLFYFKMDFDPSGSNYLRINLSYSVPPTQSGAKGYFLKIGESGDDDAVELFQLFSGTETMILRGTDGLFANSPEAMLKVQVSGGAWTMEVDTGMNGQYISQGTVSGYPLQRSHYFGLECGHTSTRSDKFYFDDFFIEPLYIDKEPPLVDSVTAINDTTVKISYSELVDSASAKAVSNYALLGTAQQVTGVSTGQTPATSYLLTVDPPLANKSTYQLRIAGVEDRAGNEIQPVTKSFPFFRPETGDLIFTELFPDPSPSIGLPEYEFVELHNLTAYELDVSEFRLSDGKDTVGFPNTVIGPGQYAIVCDESISNEFISYGRVLGVGSFPTLNNEGDELSIISPDDLVLDRVVYKNTWYKDANKSEGGWTLENIPGAICEGAPAWIASFDPSGGTPGKENSTLSSFVDSTAPAIVEIEINESRDSLMVFFSESIQAKPDTIEVSGKGVVAVSQFINASTLVVDLGFELEQGVAYDLYVSMVADCYGNATILKESIIKPFLPEKGDLVINEILFNPAIGGVDYVEILNHSDKVLSLNGLQLIEYSPETEEIEDLATIEGMQILMQPGDFFVFTADPQDVKRKFTVKNPGWLIEATDLPNLPDEDGILVLALDTFRDIDSLAYSADWHFELLADENGVSLERISADGATNDPGNWFSASSASGFGTPTYQNSQNFSESRLDGEITITPEIFSPDQDGYNDQLTITVAMDNPGYAATIQVFDMRGRFVRELRNNALLSSKTEVRWDGLTNEGMKADPGIYVIYFKIFNPGGHTIVEKRKCVLAERR